jgi:GNAT superfamily N-acetyltransferase
MSDSRLFLRPFREDDRAYVTATMLRSFVESRPRFHGADVPSFALFAGEGAALDRVLGLSDTWMLVTGEDDSAIAAYFVRHGDCLDYVYVSRELRRTGIAKRLVSDLRGIARYSHLTPIGKKLVKLLPGAVFDPYGFFLT